MNHLHKLVSYCCFLQLLVNATILDTISLKDAFDKFMIVPHEIPNPPKDKMSVIFGTRAVNPGDYVHPFETTNRPYISYPNNPTSLYTFVLFDPDIPFLYPSMRRQMLRTLSVNVLGKNLRTGDRIAPYVPHIPYPGNGPQRAIYLAYKQPNRIQVTTELRFRFSTNLTNFSMYEFAKEFKLGDPVAGNVYISELAVCDFNQTQFKRQSTLIS